ncbi:cyclodeaminase/cyclohydrolase family protein [Streptomyces cocklensis]|uniref:Formiminotetrahydrofolate cyclodeaminase n=1 Tax=Actinacidiphila cocklensis TaxID=887465 RepID=A0A9W4DXH5_9ACTN|nr:cyclodeaminase/cyclohydrolase family protein [Actinacidiphila cocklensis]WSX77473.1 cyclodeaminase/cyclohydrolase family protein [Streptomyces sp. NBC_00899]CAG6398258.1 Formiminotetrahydrofolate cyclodeaminase [Actinacidiphila cocklensis]
MHDQARIQDETVGGYLDRLAARSPAPGGGAAAALHAAQGAALLGMVARYTTGAKYAAQAEAIARITAESDELRAAALDLAAADAAAFTAVTDAYALPRADDGQKAARSAAIATALAGAARPPADVIGVARRIVALAEELLPIGNPNVVTDVAAAAEAARAAATTARVNVEINLGGIRSADTRADLTGAVSDVDSLAGRAAEVTESVRRTLNR